MDQDSLGDLKTSVDGKLLDPAVEVAKDGYESLNDLGWAGDLINCQILKLASTFSAVRENPIFYQKAGFLFQSEKALFEIFTLEDLHREVTSLADLLASRKQIEGNELCELARSVLESEAWDALLKLELCFAPPINFKDG